MAVGAGIGTLAYETYKHHTLILELTDNSDRDPIRSPMGTLAQITNRGTESDVAIGNRFFTGPNRTSATANPSAVDGIAIRIRIGNATPFQASQSSDGRVNKIILVREKGIYPK